MGWEILLLVWCILLIVIVFFTLTPKKKVVARPNMPKDIQAKFYRFIEPWMKGIGVVVNETSVANPKLEKTVPFGDGAFEICSFDYNIKADVGTGASNGIALTSREMVMRAGFRSGDLRLYFYKEKGKTSEVNFVDAVELNHLGEKEYFNERYTNLPEYDILEDYSMEVNGKKITLWENLQGEPPFEEANRIKDKSREIIQGGYEAIDLWEGYGSRIHVQVMFEGKSELVYWIKLVDKPSHTSRGISPGDTIEKMKKAYPEHLVYDQSFKGGGPCYGYAPPDGTCRYIVFFIEKQIVKEIWICDGFDQRPFNEYDGYVSGDLPWVICNNDDKLTDKYAREIYIGHHKEDFEHEKVLIKFLGKKFPELNIVEKGIWQEHMGGKVYYVVCTNKDTSEKTSFEIALEKLKVNSSAGSEDIWVVDSYRMQTAKGV